MYRVGYTNLSHFAKIFHEEFGLYPKEFALRNRSKTGKVDSASEIILQKRARDAEMTRTIFSNKLKNTFPVIRVF